MSSEKCMRCGASVAPIIGPPPSRRDTWHRYQIGLRKTAAWRLRFRIFTLKWLPESPWDQLRETYTELDLCDPCARDVFAFAQGRYEAKDADR